MTKDISTVMGGQKMSNVHGHINDYKLKAIGIMHQYDLYSVLTLASWIFM